MLTDGSRQAATKQPNKVQSAARHVGENIVKVAAASKEVAPLLTRHAQPVLVKSAKEVAELTKNHLNASKAAITNPAQHKQLEQAVKNVQQAIRALVDNARLAEASAKVRSSAPRPPLRDVHLTLLLRNATR